MWCDQNQLMHEKKDWTLEDLISHLKIEEEIRLKDKEFLITLVFLELTLRSLDWLILTGLKTRE